MDLNQLKDTLFDIINDNDNKFPSSKVEDITFTDQEDSIIISFHDKSKFEIHCRQIAPAEQI